ncbi:YcxB family protein [Devosia sp. Leaf64]|uniref:YcxB family protein n=1 Tax=Devosia sp. Leaf64 TaxID=1736229 RepID=UPI000714E552|nr:YcxB family protein [Devosia sp. Leaf64]KQN77599.1 hypothetical protein ASE94_16505 [Devosia sp. Leaf64]
MNRTADIQLLPHDLADANKLQFINSLRRPRGILSVLFLSAALSTIFGLLVWDAGNALPIAAFTIVSPLAVLAGPAFVVWVINPGTARRIFKQQASLRKPYAIAWDEAHYLAHSDLGNTKLPWSDLFRVEHNDKLIVLFESQNLRRIIPLRFLSPEQRADIEGVIAAAAPQAMARGLG